MNVSKTDLKRSIRYWAVNSYKLWKDLQTAKNEIKILKKKLQEQQ